MKVKDEKKNPNSGITPLMEQYLAIKAKYSEMILLYRMGDFYETFYEDAEIISRVLGIALTKRAHGKSANVPLAGFPYHALEVYLPKIISAGHKVAICEQTEDPKFAKTVVKREVVEVITPGTSLSEKFLQQKDNNFLASIYVQDKKCGISYCDISTGDFFLSELPLENLVDYLLEIAPKEILVQQNIVSQIKSLLEKKIRGIITKLDDWLFSFNFAYEQLTAHFNTTNLKGFGAEDYRLGIIAAGAILQYLKENYQNNLEHITKLSVFSPNEFMILDSTTRRNLEITSPILGGGIEGTLLYILDATLTPMGGRLLKQIINHPFKELEPIKERISQVESFYDEIQLTREVRNHLKSIGDLERLLARITTGKALPRDLISLKNTLQTTQPIRELLKSQEDTPLERFRNNLGGTEKVIELIEESIQENPPNNITEGDLINDGYNLELDELRRITREGKSWIYDLQNKEREKTKIPTLKIGFNKVFGYYFEVTKTHNHKIPDYFIRKQTLVNSERYITPELKEYEEKVLGAEERMAEIEYEIFQEIRSKIAAEGEVIQRNAKILAQIDCITNFAYIAKKNNYTKPEINLNLNLEIQQSRHPVVEKLLPPDQPFIENDIYLDCENTQIMIITGPNMAGKSTYLRQVGLIVLMAQIGSFVPARKSKIGVVDRIFTRVGASDNLAFGESTFMVEMLETANILSNSTPRSLILLDEIGRGTSTFDGLSLAWAVTEYIHNTKNIHSKTLFATHYHELTELALLYPQIKNFKISVREDGDQVIFLRKIEEGGMDNSYGIYVAQMAGLPIEVIERAKEVLHNLESNELNPNKTPKLAERRFGSQVNKKQLNLFEIMKPSVFEEELKKVDINRLTPIEALIKLQKLQEMVLEGQNMKKEK
jgi:DNA mismatch repair protein MutS